MINDTAVSIGFENWIHMAAYFGILILVGVVGVRIANRHDKIDQ